MTMSKFSGKTGNPPQAALNLKVSLSWASDSFSKHKCLNGSRDKELSATQLLALS